MIHIQKIILKEITFYWMWEMVYILQFQNEYTFISLI
jgi:hypothetical protein